MRVHILGIILSTFFSRRPIVYEDSSWVSGEVRTYHDYSRIQSSHPVIYMLPHLWTGVIPRMMDGYKCVVADQMVADHLDSWRSLLRSGFGVNTD